MYHAGSRGPGPRARVAAGHLARDRGASRPPCRARLLQRGAPARRSTRAVRARSRWRRRTAGPSGASTPRRDRSSMAPSAAASIASAGSPITSAASASASIVRRSGSAGVNTGAMSHSAGAQDARQRHRRARAGVERERPTCSIGTVEKMATDATGAVGRDRHVRHHRVVAAQVLDGRDQAEVDAALVQQRGARRPARRSARRTARAGPRGRGRAGLVFRYDTAPRRAGFMRAGAPSRSTGVKPAAVMLRRTSSRLARRRPSAGSSTSDTRSRSLAPKVSATCASLGPYCCQSTCDRRRRSASPSRASATTRTSSIAGRRRGHRLLARQRRKRASRSLPPCRNAAHLRATRATRPSSLGCCTVSARTGRPAARTAATSRRASPMSIGASAIASRPAALSRASTSVDGRPRRARSGRPAKSP